MSEYSKEVKEAVEAIEAKLSEAVTQYEGEVKEYGEATNKIRDEVKALSEEHKSIVESMPELKDRLKELEQRAADGFKGNGDQAENKSWGQVFIESDGLKSFTGGEGSKMRVEVKNTLMGELPHSPQTIDNTLVQADRLPGIVPGAFRALNILDFVPTGVTASNQIEYTREASWTNSAAETEEAATKPEAELTFELVQDPVRTIAHWIKATKQILDDAPALQSYIDRRLRHGVQNRVQTQVLKGDGSMPNISGLSDTGRHTAFTPETGETALDSLNRAKYAVIGADYSPNFIFMNPADFGAIERLKETADGNKYLASDGAALSYINGGMTPMIWGLPVVTSNDVASGKFYLGDSNAFQLFMRQGVMVEMSESDGDNFRQNLLTIRAELRAAMAVYVPTAVRYGDLTQ